MAAQPACRSRSSASGEDEPPEKHKKGRSTHSVSIKPQYKPQIKEKLEFRKIRVLKIRAEFEAIGSNLMGLLPEDWQACS